LSQRLIWWFGLMGLGGVAFGLIGDRRPFGNDMFAHPLAVYFITVGIALLVLRFASRRPVPEIISERSLLAGCLVGAVTFLIGNWLAAHLVGS
jgi:hypothetical protein